MGLTHETLVIEVTSAVGAAAVGDPLRIGGHEFDIQFYCPIADLVGLECSNDRATWYPATDDDGADVNGPTTAITVDAFRPIREQPEWIRLIVAADAGGARIFRGIVGVHKLTS